MRSALPLFLVTVAAGFASSVHADNYDDIAVAINELNQSNTQFQDEDARLYHLFDAIWEWQMIEYPTYATYVGYPGQNHRWADGSFPAEERREQLDVELLAALKKIDPSKLSSGGKLDWQLVTQSYELDIEGQQFPSSLMPIDQMGGVQSDISQTIGMMPVSNKSEYDDILARLGSANILIENDLLRLQRGLSQGITPPQVTLRDLPEQFDALLNETISETPFWGPFKSFPSSIEKAEQNEITAAATSIIRDKLQPAFVKLKTYLEEDYIPNARKEIGLSSLPNGDAWYAYSARSRTTTNLSPTEIHNIGLSEVKRLSEKLDATLDEIGFEGDFEALKAFMHGDDQFYHTDPNELVVGYRDICKRADAAHVKIFGILPRLPYGVEVVPPHIAPSAPTAYYMGGSLEAGRSGFFYANTHDLRARPIWGMEPLSLHEAVPGHHLQISIAKELGELHDLRKNLRYTAYVEGWGLYAETLGYEMGFYTDPYAKIGQISYEMWRAIRLVVDTGMHSLGWSRQRAIDYFKANSILLEHDLTVEIDRYIVWPTQALAYKIGQLKFQELRDRASQELGDKFEIRAFHDQVLGSGAIPLDVLEEQVQAWIDEQK